jgi:hypothetical protein
MGWFTEGVHALRGCGQPCPEQRVLGVGLPPWGCPSAVAQVRIRTGVIMRHAHTSDIACLYSSTWTGG